MSFYRTCSECGAHLDYGEICDCTRQECPECGTLYINHTGHTYTQCPRCHAAMDKEKAAPGATNTENSQAQEVPTQVDSTTEPARMSNAEMVELIHSLSQKERRHLQRFCWLLAHSPGFCDEYKTALTAAGSLDGLGVDGVEALMKKWEANIAIAWGEKVAE